MSPSRSAAFTLIEVLAVLFLTALVLGVALNFFIDLSNQSARATQTTREVRRATSLLDRVAHDLERTFLIRKPAETDPLAHPWIFIAESRVTDGGADRVKFVTRRSPEGRFDAPRSDLAVVTYTLRARGDDTFDLMRSSSPLPEQLDREFPLGDEPNLVPLAEGVERFSLRFLGEDGEWVEEWDSSQLLDSSELPVAVEIEVALAEDDPAQQEPFDAEEALTYKRRVMLPLRPFDLAALFDPSAEVGVAEDVDGDGQPDHPAGNRTVAQCVMTNVLAKEKPRGTGPLGGLGDLSPAELEALRRFVENAETTPFSEVAALYCGHPAVRPDCC